MSARPIRGKCNTIATFMVCGVALAGSSAPPENAAAHIQGSQASTTSPNECSKTITIFEQRQVMSQRKVGTICLNVLGSPDNSVVEARTMPEGNYINGALLGDLACKDHALVTYNTQFVTQELPVNGKTYQNIFDEIYAHLIEVGCDANGLTASTLQAAGY